jgi:hypothetical protein
MEVNMKNKWVRWTLTALLTLIVLAGVGGAGFRLGIMQGRNIELRKEGAPPPFAHSQRFGNNEFNKRLGSNGQDSDHNNRREFNRGFQHGFRRGGLLSIFGLIRLAVLGLIIWGGYTLYQRSGWRFVKVNASEAEPVEEAKPESKKKK